MTPFITRNLQSSNHNIMRYLIFCLSLFIITGSAKAQNVININATANVLVPADKIAFHVNINAEGDTPQQAYDLHKKREQVLVELLKKHNIKEQNINFEPISISRITEGRYNGEPKEFVRTRQTVTLSLDDFSLYEEIQLALIENGFDEFNGNFRSSKTEQGEDEALKKALKLAREKANIIANETGLSISGIKDISYSYNQDGPRPVMEMAMQKSSDSLMEFDQTVSISASVSVTYNFNE